MNANKQQQQVEAAEQGLLLSKPGLPTEAGGIGLQPLGLSVERDALIYVPTSYRAERPTPLVLMLHGAGGNAQYGLAPFLNLADEAGIILLAPSSRRQTWDMLFGSYGCDITLIDRALAQTFKHYNIDPTHIAIEGFSDGASYALSVGIINGYLFTHIIAFSPGFMLPIGQQDSPHFFISHGIQDTVLNIDRCSRKIVPLLQGAHYNVVYQEFNGSHTIPLETARSALTWFTSGTAENTAFGHR